MCFFEAENALKSAIFKAVFVRKCAIFKANFVRKAQLFKPIFYEKAQLFKPILYEKTQLFNVFLSEKAQLFKVIFLKKVHFFKRKPPLFLRFSARILQKCGLNLAAGKSARAFADGWEACVPFVAFLFIFLFVGCFAAF